VSTKIDAQQRTPEPCFEHAGVQCTVGRSSFVPTPVVTESGHARALEDTHAWVKPLLRRVPITRVINVTPLDFVGLPVWSAVTPLAKDLTVHAGKGRNALASQLSAIMEAIERVCGESMPASCMRRASYEALMKEGGPPVLDPEALGLPFDTSYTPDHVIRWTLGYDVAHDEHVWVPVDFVISPPEECVCTSVETNGLASGNTITEAVVHALYELIERDALSIEQFCELHAEHSDRRAPPVRMVDTSQLPEDSRAWVDRLVASDLRVVVQDLTSEIGVPVFAAYLIDPAFAGNAGQTATFAGYGCDLAPPRAVFRAITEAVQSHSIVSLGARDTFEGTRPLPDRNARLRRRLDVSQPRTLVPFSHEDPGSGDLWRDLQVIVQRLATAGLERCVVADLTRADLGVPVVRVLVQGLEGPYGSSTRRPGLRLLRRLA
jgi:YcaO-like protein with predicted kinase domain